MRQRREEATVPRGFSTQDRDRIRHALLDAGRSLFTDQGLRKTSLEELVAPAGIVKSTFYQFFDSKEALYLQLMLDEAGQVKRQVIDRALLSTDDTREALRRFLHATVDVLEHNPLWRRLVTHPEEMTAVAARLEPGQTAALGADDPSAALVEYVAARQRRGDLIGDDPAVVVGALQSVLLLPMNRQHLGGGYRQTLDLLVDLVATGLTTHEGD
jgi:AcrR family transcriptional regulator